MTSNIEESRTTYFAKTDGISIGLFLAGLIFYLYTLAPSVNWADGARLQLDVTLGGSTYWYFDEVKHIPTDGWPFDHLGVAAWDHPLYVMLGQLFLRLPWGEPPFRLNLMSAMAAALSIALVYHLGLFLTANPWASMLGAIALAVSHTFWFHAVTTEVYALNAVFIISLVGLTLRWSQTRCWSNLALFALLSGLSLANHLMLGLTVLVTLSYMLVMSLSALKAARDSRPGFPTRNDISLFGSRRIWQSLALVGLFFVGFTPWWVQCIRMVRIIGLPTTLEIAVGFPWLGRRLVIQSAGSAILNLTEYGAWLLYQFTPIGVGLGLYGLWHMQRQRSDVARLLLAFLIVHIVFSANYTPADQFSFHLSSYLVFALAIIWSIAALMPGLNARLPNRRRWSFWAIHGLLFTIVLTPIAIYAITPSILRAAGFTEARLGVQPIGTGVRDTLAYFLNPNKRGDDSAARFGRSTLSHLAPNAFVFTPKPSDQEAYIVLRYFQLAQGLRPDVRLELMLFGSEDSMPDAVLAQAQSQLGCRPLYLASLHPDTIPLESLRGDFDIVPEANLYRLVPYHPRPKAKPCPDLESDWADITLEQLIRRAMRWS